MDRGGQRGDRSTAGRSASRCRRGRRGRCGSPTGRRRRRRCCGARRRCGVRVPARVSGFSARRTGARRFRLSGRLLGGAVPARGKLDRAAGLRARALAAFRHGAVSSVDRPLRDRLPVPPRVGRADASGCACACGRTELPVRGRLLAGGAGPRAMSAPRTCRRSTRWPRRSRRRGALALAAARAVLAERRAELLAGAVGRGRSRRAGAGVGARRHAAVAAAGAERDRRDRAHEPGAGAAGRRPRSRRSRPPRAGTRTSSSTCRPARGGRGTRTSRRCCAR